MIMSCTMKEEPQMIYTIVEHPRTKRWVKVGMTEEELFRKVLGDEEFEKRLNKANAEAAAQEERRMAVRHGGVGISPEEVRTRPPTVLENLVRLTHRLP